MWWLLIAILLYILAAFLIIAEVFVPSGGIISIMAAGALAAGVYLFFTFSVTAGWIGIVLAVIMVPAVIYFAYRIFPHTSFGRAVILSPGQRTAGDAIPDTPNLKGLLNKTATTLTPLRPVGMCDFDGKKLECVAETGYIEKGVTVKVIRVEGTQLTVEAEETKP